MAHTNLQTDSAGHSFVEIPVWSGERLRVTLIPDEGFRQDRHYRLQIIDESTNRPRPGPELPEKFIGELMNAFVCLAQHKG